MREKILRLPQVMERTGLSRSMIYFLISIGEFPKQIKLTLRTVGWLESQIDGWIENRITTA
jgi:prophage regulatory protein